jgi:hypothetical protein
MGVVVVVESLIEGVVGVVTWVIEGGGALGWVIGGSKAVEGVVRIGKGVARFCIGVVRFCDGVGVEGIVMMVRRGVVVVGGESASAVVEEGVARGVEGGAGGWGLEEEAAAMVGVVAGVVCAVDGGWGCCSLLVFLLVEVDGEVVCGLVVVGAMAVDWELSEVLKAWVGMLLAGSSSFLGRWCVADGAESVGGMPVLKEWRRRRLNSTNRAAVHAFFFFTIVVGEGIFILFFFNCQ